MANYLVTGANGGMGSALCRMLTAEGHAVWGIDCTEPDSPEGWHHVPADITRTADVEAALNRVSSEAGRLDGIIHAAGVYDLNSLIEMPEEEFLRDFDINLFGVFRINRAFVPLLAKGGRIVIITSELASLSPLPFTGIYAVTKTALDQYASALRMELQLLDHPVIVLRPGAVRTAMLPASTRKLDRFCETTRLYSCNADRFRKIVGAVEARSIPPEAIAAIISRALKTPHPRLTYHINRNPLLLIFEALPARLKLKVIRKILS